MLLPCSSRAPTCRTGVLGSSPRVRWNPGDTDGTLAQMASLLRGQLVLQLSHGVAAVLAIAWVLALARVLAPHEANELFAALAIVTVVQSAVGTLRTSLARRCAWLHDDPSARLHVVRAAELAVVRIGAPSAVVVAAVLAGVAERVGMAAATGVAIVAAVLARMLHDTARGGLAGAGRPEALARDQLVEALARITIGALVLAVVPTPAAAIASYAAGSLLAWRLARAELGTPGPDTRAVAAATWASVGALACWNVLVAAAQQLDTLLVALGGSPAEAPAYGAVATLVRGFALLALPVQLQLGPQLCAGFARGRFEVRTLLVLLGTYLGLATVPLTICAVWPTAVLALAYGDAFLAAGPVLLPPLALAAMLVHFGVTLAVVMIARARMEFLWRYGVAVALHSFVLACTARDSVVAAAHVAWIGQLAIVVLLAREALRVSRAAAAAPGTSA